MSDEAFVQDRPRNPFAPSGGQEVATRPVASLGALASAEQQRVLGELQAQIMLAKMNPRDPQAAVDSILRDCSRISLAKDGEYQYARGGTDIHGPSIKLVEAIARRWGNINSGFKIIHSENGASDVLSYAWDLETGYRDERQFQVRHIRDTRNGPVKVTDERDVYELIANNAQRRKRACLIAVIPADVIEAAVEQCNETLAANVDTSVEGLKKLLRAFAEFGVTQQQIEQRIQCRLEAIQPGQVTQLSKVYTSLKDGMSQPSQWFRAVDPPRTQPTRGTSQVKTPKTTEKTPENPEKTPKTPPEAPTSASSQVAPDAPSEKTGLFTNPEQPENTDGEGGKPPPVVSPSPDASPGVSDEQSEFDNAFEHVVLDDTGDAIDDEVHLDPLTWAQAFMGVYNATHEKDRPALIARNTDALHDCSEMSPEADALLDGIVAEPVGELPASEPEVSRDEQITAAILSDLGRITTVADVIAFSKSAAVMVPIGRWQQEGQTGRVASVRGAFTARLENLKKAGAA